MINIDYSFLTRVNLSKQPKGVLALIGHKLEWLTNDMLKSKRTGHDLTSTILLRTIAKTLLNIDFSNLNFDQAKMLMNNLVWLDQKIVNRRNTNPFYYIFYARLKKPIAKLACEHLDDLILHLLQFQDKKLKKAKILRMFDVVELLHLADPSLASSLLSHRWKILDRLIGLNHFGTVVHYRVDEQFSSFINLQLTNDQTLAQKYPNISILNEVFLEFKKFPTLIQNQNKFFQTLLYIKKLLPQESGMPCFWAKPLKKIKNPVFLKQEKLPYTLYFDAGKTVAYLTSFLKKGGYKVAKKYIDIRKRQIFVFTRQAITTRHKTRIEKENKMMKDCKGLTHVVQFLLMGQYLSKTGVEKLICIMPFYNQGNLQENLRKLAFQKDKLKITMDIIKGLMNLHSLKIIHCDLKPANIFLDVKTENLLNREAKSKEYYAVVADLGLACWTENDPDRNKACGTLAYTPPEVYRDSLFLYRGPLAGEFVHTFESDIWSLGITLYELFYQINLCEKYELKKHDDFVSLSIMWSRLYRLDTARITSQDSIEFVISQLLQPFPEARMKLDEALKRVEMLYQEVRQADANVN